MLNDIAVNHIRDLARLYSRGILQNINITAGHTDEFDDEALAAYRIDAIFQLLKDFGVEEGDISADMKIYKSELRIYIIYTMGCKELKFSTIR